MNNSSDSSSQQPESPGRRDFLTRAGAVAVSGVVVAVPVGAGITVFLDPLTRKAHSGTTVRVTQLQNLPDDGTPKKFPIIAERTDAWNKFPSTPIGAIYLRRLGDEVIAFNTSCPHAGCFVDYKPDENQFSCPCHNSKFELDGSLKSGVSPRPMDELEVSVKEGGEVWVTFRNFKAGHAHKEPIV